MSAPGATLLLLALPLAAQGLRPGSETTFHWAPVQTDLQVWIPNDYDAGKLWPVVVHFHGTGGRPDLGPAVRATDGNGFLVVGTTYLERGMFRADPEQVIREWNNTKALVAALRDRYAIDGNRIYVSGFSKGGWVAGMMFEQFPDEIAGVWIAGAGVTRKNPKAKNGRTSTPVYLGTGAKDVNRIASLQAVTAFQKRKAQVSYEEYPDRGHTYVVTEAVRDWYEIERLRGTDDLAAAAEKKVADTLAVKLEPWPRYLSIDALRRGPWYGLAAAESRKACDAAVARLAKSSVLKTELAAMRAYDKVLAREVAQRGKPIRARSVAEADKKARQQKRKLLADYNKIAERFAGTTYGDKARGDVDRVKRHLAHMSGR